MQKLLGDNDIIMYSIHYKGRLVVAEKFIKTLNAKMYTNMAANDSKSYLGYLN